MSGVDPEAGRFALAQIKDGTLFENFTLDFLSKILGYEFIPAGGIRDRGIDGFEHAFHKKGYERTIYQLSIQENYSGKIRDSLDKLRKNKVKFDHFIYVTNIPIKYQDMLVDKLVEDYHVAINIYDQKWFVLHINDSEGTIRSFQTFIDSYLHDFNKPGHSYVVANLDKDPRLYVFLRQQLDERKGETRLDEVLVDTLILYALEDTNPDTDSFMTNEEIRGRLRDKVKFDPRVLDQLIDKRLEILSSKPVRRIHCHSKGKGYCLDYQERLAIKNRNLNDAAMYEQFKEDTRIIVGRLVPVELSSRFDFVALVEQLLNWLFYKQGIEFADFVLHAASREAFEKSLPDILSEVVDGNSLVLDNKEKTKSALLAVIRGIVYGGTRSQQEFLNRLSHTYVMILLLQCDPKICIYFNSMASKLRVYVCSSIIIPALSEQFLEERNRRYSNLLKSAGSVGVNLIINEAILTELAAHFRMIRRIFDQQYADNERIYVDDMAVMYVPEITIRAYFYARNRGQVKNFDEFLGTFISPGMTKVEDNVVEWLKAEFGIEFVSNANLGIHLDANEIDKIAEQLAPQKRHASGAAYRAKIDAQVMLTVHRLRDRDNESGDAGIFGYRTWWLTKDVTTEKAATLAAGSKYATTCYMRPDFLYNYISLAPKTAAIEEAFRQMFPTLIGVDMSYYLPEEVVKIVHLYVKDYGKMHPSRVIGAIRALSDELKQCSDDQLVQRTREFMRNKARVKQDH